MRKIKTIETIEKYAVSAYIFNYNIIIENFSNLSDSNLATNIKFESRDFRFSRLYLEFFFFKRIKSLINSNVVYYLFNSLSRNKI